jgi:NAD+ synthase
MRAKDMNIAKLIDYIVDWLKNYCEEAKMTGFVVGISGGVDSAVTSTLCVRTGREVFLLNMPIYQPQRQVALAEQHIQWLEENYSNARGFSLDLTLPFQSLEKTFPQDIQDGLSMANTRARLRMLTLYAFASHHRMLVAGTGNKVEDFGVGFFTKYGDGGVDVSPIADLVKTEVYALAKEMGINEGILNAPPTDGLWEDERTDENQLGATYAELEWAMQFETEPSTEDQLEPRQIEIIDIYRKFYQTNKHKMEPIPFPKIPKSMK